MGRFLPIYFIALALIAIFTFTQFPIYTYAQDPVVTSTVTSPVPLPELPTELPETATGALPFIEKWLLFASALLATHIMTGVKNIPWFGKQSWFVKLTTELVSGVTASVLAFGLGTAAVGLGFLDQSGLWQVIAFAWPAAVGIYHTKKFSKAGALVAAK